MRLIDVQDAQNTMYGILVTVFFLLMAAVYLWSRPNRPKD